MKVGFVGLGKLGLPCSIAAQQAGHDVVGLEKDDQRRGMILRGEIEDLCVDEPGIQEEWDALVAGDHGSYGVATSMAELLSCSELVMVCVETPHPPLMDGSRRHRKARQDFDYGPLLTACDEIAEAIRTDMTDEQGPWTVVIVSTVLPGTTRRMIAPILLAPDIMDDVTLIYSPSFIAQTTIVQDYKKPEFALVGLEESWGYIADCPDVAVYRHYLISIHNAQLRVMSWESAELAKMLYNTFIGFKIVLANTAAEICENISHADAFDVMKTLQQATDRIISPKYMLPGMGDGGGCHPRDNLALAALCDQLGLAYNPFGWIMDVREQQTEFLAKTAMQARRVAASGLHDSITILGSSFKAGSRQTVGSPAVLLFNILKEIGADCAFFNGGELPQTKVYVLAVPERYAGLPFPDGCVVIDPWGVVERDNGSYIVHRVGAV